MLNKLTVKIGEFVGTGIDNTSLYVSVLEEQGSCTKSKR